MVSNLASSREQIIGHCAVVEGMESGEWVFRWCWWRTPSRRPLVINGTPHRGVSAFMQRKC
eukprot:scaffold2536_cov67-Skeletonema_dohrnii-CCMP3373.AAC.1